MRISDIINASFLQYNDIAPKIIHKTSQQLISYETINPLPSSPRLNIPSIPF